ncbi:hypothetical protein LXL04_006584 [Taraxacum kok-saghyz]
MHAYSFVSFIPIGMGILMKFSGKFNDGSANISSFFDVVQIIVPKTEERTSGNTAAATSPQLRRSDRATNYINQVNTPSPHPSPLPTVDLPTPSPSLDFASNNNQSLHTFRFIPYSRFDFMHQKSSYIQLFPSLS